MMTTTIDFDAIRSYSRHRDEPEADARALQDALTFTDKASYLAWVDAWKAEINATNARIVELRKLLSQPHHLVPDPDDIPAWARGAGAARAMLEKAQLRRYARALYLLRTLSKEMARERRAAVKAQLQASA